MAKIEIELTPKESLKARKNLIVKIIQKLKETVEAQDTV